MSSWQLAGHSLHDGRIVAIRDLPQDTKGVGLTQQVLFGQLFAVNDQVDLDDGSRDFGRPCGLAKVLFPVFHNGRW